MFNSFLPILYGIFVLFLLRQAFVVMKRGFEVNQAGFRMDWREPKGAEDRTGRLTVHPELLDENGQITNEELLTVRFSEDIDPTQSAETSAE